MADIASAAVTEDRSRSLRVIGAVSIGSVGALAAALTAWYVVDSPTLYRPTGTGILRGVYVAAYAATGGYTWWSRPTSRLGQLLRGIGLFYAACSLNASANEVVFTFGMVIWGCWVASLMYMALCFPRSRPVTLFEQRFSKTFLLATAALWALILAFADELPKGGEFSDCGTRCPPNGLRVVDTPDAVGRVLDALYGVLLAASLIGVAAVLIRKARSPSRLRRRAVEPLSYVVTATIIVFVLNSIAVRALPETKTAFWVVEAVVAFAAPAAIVAGQVRGRMFAAVSAGQMVAALSGRPVTPEGIQALMRETLGDPTLVLAV